MIVKIMEWVRLGVISLAFFFAYWFLSDAQYDAVWVFEWLVPAIMVPMAGFSGFEGLIWGEESAREKGYETGSNYQKQSDIALLSYAFTALMVFVFDWGKFAALAVLICGMFFFFFSGINHALQAIFHKNFHWANINRPFILFALILALIYPVMRAFVS
ncbi:MAG: hypothetical protein Q7J34_06685 [Bacteroidales bacterium]|jgi:hypothetical protein|nr:hypothetical protein [Bacteroidales bacterium]